MITRMESLRQEILLATQEENTFNFECSQSVESSYKEINITMKGRNCNVVLHP